MLCVTIEHVSGGRTKVLATASVGNISELAAVSDYDVIAAEAANALTGREAWCRRFAIEGHDRNSSVWRLVEKIARAGGDAAESP